MLPQLYMVHCEYYTMAKVGLIYFWLDLNKENNQLL